MVKDGYEDIMNIDISSVAIEMMREKYEQLPQLSFQSNASPAESFFNETNSSNNFLPEGQQMLSFSSPYSQTVTLPYYHPSSIAFARNAGYGSGGLNAGSMHGVLSGVRGSFTPSQWMELEHQALIYKYINANVPIPSYLLTPIRKALDYAGFTPIHSLKNV